MHVVVHGFYKKEVTFIKHPKRWPIAPLPLTNQDVWYCACLVFFWAAKNVIGGKITFHDVIDQWRFLPNFCGITMT